MASSTRASRRAANEALNALSNVSLTTALELFAAGNALQQSKKLRAALSDPSAEPAGKEHLVQSVFGSKLSAQAVSLVTTLCKLRWSSTRDLPATLEQLGVRIIAKTSSSIEKLQTELFALEQVASSDDELELALSSTKADFEQKQVLVQKLFSGKVSEESMVLANQAIESRSYKRYAEVLGQYGVWVAEYAGESVARVRVSRPLSSQQIAKLETALEKSYGRKLQLNIDIDASVVGGIHIAVAGEIIDATIQTKLSNARLQLS
jgi:F-type H+-transporting ATPase subunit delta